MLSVCIAPRLSSRLLIAKYGNEIVGIDEVLRDRNTALTAIEASPDNCEFKMDLFLPHTDSQRIKRTYRQFVDLVSSMSDEITQRNASWTMYNILIRRGSTKQGREEITSYFGHVDDSRYDNLLAMAIELEKAQLSKAAGQSVQKQSSSFGSDLQFHQPMVFHNEFDRLFSRSDHTGEPVGKDTEKRSMVDKPSSEKVLTLAEEVKYLVDMASAYVQESSSSFDALHIAEEVISVVFSSPSDDLLQARLFELLGEAGWTMMETVLTNAASLRKHSEREFKGQIKRRQDAQGGGGSYQGESDISGKNLSANQRKKLDKRLAKQQQEMAKSGSSSHITSADVDVDWLREAGFREQYLEQERLLGLQGGLPPAASTDSWLLGLAAEGTREHHEKRGLPAGTTRKTGEGFEEVDIPAPPKGRHGVTEEELISIDALDDWAKPAFAGTKRFNPIQSKVFDVAYNSPENMLICAPTGAGKTNIAMLSYLHLVKQHVSADGVIDKKSIKGIYIAPMKALAQEVVEKFSARLKPLGLVVREFTGDMQLSRQEVADSQLIVTTPEKWDVVTRKGGDGSLGTLVSLIIIDEVHLLAEDRGAVIETIVARTQRYIESSQTFVRIVGLSATLPNYEDVASFLRVNRSIGLFHFGPEFRPVPLRQTFIGVTEKQRVRRNNLMNRFAYDKVVAALENDKQVMIFVHSRRDTSKTLEALRELIAKNNSGALFENIHHEKYNLWKKQVSAACLLAVHLSETCFLVKSSGGQISQPGVDSALLSGNGSPSCGHAEVRPNSHRAVVRVRRGEGALLHRHACMGSELAWSYSHHQRYRAVRSRARWVCGPLHLGRLPDIRSRRSTPVRYHRPCHNDHPPQESGRLPGDAHSPSANRKHIHQSFAGSYECGNCEWDY
jgi:hypothetical protein